MALDGSMNGDAFRAYVEQALVPELNKRDVVILDNLAAYKVGAIRTMIEAAGVRILYLPPYSSDFSPIEMAFPNSKPCSKKPLRGLSPSKGWSSPKTSRNSRPKITEITSPRKDITWSKLNLL